MNIGKRITAFSTLSMTVFFELAAYYAIIVVISHYVLLSSSLYIASMMWIAGACGILIPLLLRTRQRWMNWVCILLAGGVIFAGTGQFNTGIRGWVLCVVLIGVAFRGNRLTEQGWKVTFTPMYQLQGIGCTLVLSIFSYNLSLTAIDAGSLYVAGLISLCSWILQLNSQQVRRETLSNHSTQQGAFRGFVRVNRGWSILVILGMVIFGAFTQLSQGLYWLWNQFAHWLSRIIDMMNQRSKPINPESAPIPELFPIEEGAAKEAGPTIWMDLIYWTVKVIIALVVLYILFRIVRFITVKIGQFIAKLYSKRGDSRTQVKDIFTYRDKIEKIEKNRRSFSFRRKRNILPDNPHGKVRYYYKSMVQRAIREGLEYSTSQTPNEIAFLLEGNKNGESVLSTSAVNNITSLYNDVRYGNKTIEDHQWKGAIDHLKDSK
ncbi:DUF4129 domain-containing protein [Paenibacillus macquariensis]|uniref:Protein-glutamine gamma-glutamyltransferase-like C-terminal domain-containing protein n=1 Tax=Paenibacillus macquariensis TaxID=948756 RepID=A0ABY1JS26_9BACL|nr:DUF4129 domain-containing protein [Paenibacillus macquariensis]MEC0092847.1 DUF4129 domain-containing protein [Paenibacillus macquariensis]OAB36226.1 hypothetical protein PMSM_07180 [Paenibacillus macquariensis subsp. macquariensis]SIQ67431.1 protein of unknown function [Paenibacillus macquariensis]